ncbi:MAG: hypothetical protein IPF49_15755 [Gammaproteobacteria bacterium]|jgi:hypothetical protein|nr:hypothetical protein [Gammaproteobacteria bacterium]
MSTWILIGLTVVVIVIIVLVRHSRGKGRSKHLTRRLAQRRETLSAAKRAKAPSEGPDLFRGAMLFPQKEACEAIAKLRGHTYADARIPKIPVPGCDRESCDCQLHPVTGRRRGPRRVTTDRRDDVRFKDDRRKGDDRREGADAWNQRID